QNWERAAMIKARPCAGDLALGESFLREVAPFVWRKYLDYGAVADVHAMKRQMAAYKGHDAIAIEGHNIKLGRGGIREIEFFVQTQQLIAGGQLLGLDEEFDLADAAAPKIDVMALDRDRVVALVSGHLALHRMHIGDRTVVEILAPDKRRDLAQERLTQR